MKNHRVWVSSEEPVSKFYTYHQNNSGGSFVVNEKSSLYVIVEAYSAEDADFRAEACAGLYFDGDGDCSCCGNRWYEGSLGVDTPSIHETPVNDYRPYTDWNNTSYPDVYIYYLDGTVEGVYFVETDDGKPITKNNNPRE